ncbi:MAG: hypothetical protein CK548_04950 [Opitutia bacterium]|nr:hypothetical protein [Opitutaceae bacterium]PHX72155.1 MAG: hypothetical protein CK548_04950 [Opitutae bacterium]
MNPRFPRLLLLLAVCALPVRAAPTAAASSAPPITGPALPGLAAVDTAMRGLLEKHPSTGGQLAVAYRCRLVLSRGYGFADRDIPAPATLVARLATCGASRQASRP